MKKKGLIISTIVMVLVLAASLTTATYAWFTQTAQNTITAINFSVNAGSDVVIGLKTDNIYEANPVPGAFVSGETNITGTYFSENVFSGNAFAADSPYWGGTPGLGNEINTNVDLSGMTKAVGTGKVSASAATLNLSAVRNIATTEVEGTVIAEGDADGADGSTAEAAIAQKDYLDVVIGVQAAKANLASIVCNVTVVPNEGNPQLGLNAAIHVAYEIDGMIDEDSTPQDIYGTANHYSTTPGNVVSSSPSVAVAGNLWTTLGGAEANGQIGTGAINYPITVKTVAEGSLDTATIYQLHLLIWIDGADSDCIRQGLGVGSKININFSTTETAVAPVEG